MARRTFDVIDVAEILVHWHAGRSPNEMPGSLGVDRKTLRKYVAPAVAPGIEPRGPAKGGRSRRRSRRPRVTAERVAGGNLDQDDPDAVGILDPHLDQSPGLGDRFPDDWYSGRGQPGVFRADIPHLDPDHHRTLGRPGRVPGDLEQSLAEEEDRSRMVRGAELPVNGQAQDVTVEPQATVQVTGAAGSGCSERPRCHSTITSGDKDQGPMDALSGQAVRCSVA
jgi:hypothetical protein